ncbi:MAG: hypothetical protein WCK67_07490 [bacterium]
MKILPQVQQTITRNFENGVKNFANSKLMTNHIETVLSNETAAAKALIVANVARDTVNYSMYFNQSLNNKKIPEDKRKYIAAFDMANGLLVCASQIGLGFLFTNKKLNDNITKKLFGNLNETAPNLFNKCKKGYIVVSSLIISSLIAKRVIVPFIASPLAESIKTKFLKDDKTNEKIPPINYADSFQYAKPLITYRGKNKLTSKTN